MFTPVTQVDHVLAHLKAGKTITPASAIAVYGIFRLASVIEDIRKRGYEVDTMLKRDEMGKRYGEYRLRAPIALGSKVQLKPGHGIGLPRWVRSLNTTKVVGKLPSGVSLVRFQRGQNMLTEYINDKELINVGE